MITVKPYTIFDLAKIEKRGRDFLISDTNIAFSATANNSDTWSLWIGEDIAAIFGAQNMWEGVAQVWAIVSDAAIGHGKDLTKTANILLNEHAAYYKTRRFNALVNEGIEENLRWIRRLNFKSEFVMYRAAPDGNNMVGFVRWMQKPEV